MSKLTNFEEFKSINKLTVLAKKELLGRFIHQLSQLKSIDLSAEYLLACSGGVDSMVLADLLIRSRIKFQVAHVNYKLRGVESDENQKFVLRFCEQHSIPFHVLICEKGLIGNIQNTARTIRYNWFNQVLINNKLSGILTAHHADDQLETILFNLIRGSGLNGMVGMEFEENRILRPLLFADKNEILLYAAENNISYSVDSSNLLDKYSRNKIRKTVIPLLKKINLNASKHAVELSKIVSQNQYEKENKEIKKFPYLILAEEWLSQKYPQYWLGDLLLPLGFQKADLQLCEKSFKQENFGAKFLSKEYIAVITQKGICIGYKTALAPEITPTKLPLKYSHSSFIFKAWEGRKWQETSFQLNPKSFTNNISFSPIKPGMRMRLGKSKITKKINALLSDLKISIAEKNHCVCILDGIEVIGIFPYFVNEEYSSNSNDLFYLNISLEKA